MFRCSTRAALVALAVIAGVLIPASATTAQQADTATVSGLVWIDLNADGIRGDDEPRAQGLTVTIDDVSFSNPGFSETTVSNAQGEWSFVVPASSYRVIVQPTGSALFTLQTQGNRPDRDSDVQRPGATSAFSAVAGANVELDAGILPWGTIVVDSWTDRNADGVRQSGEFADPAATYSLTPVDDPTQPITPFGEDVRYEYARLPFGSYLLTVEPLERHSLTAQGQGINPANDSDVDPASGQREVTVGPQAFTQTVGLGMIPDPGILAVLTYEDLNLDGARAADEPIVTVDMELSSGLVDEVLSGELQVDGSSQFSGARPLDYALRLTDQALATGLRFANDQIVTESIPVAVGFDPVTSIEVPLTRVWTLDLAVDDPNESVQVTSPTLTERLTIDSTPTPLGVTFGTTEFVVTSEPGLQVTAIDCGLTTSEFVQLTPTQSRFTVTVATDEPNPMCTLQTVKLEAATIVIGARQTVFITGTLAANEIEIDHRLEASTIDVNPGTHQVSIAPSGEFRRPALFCAGAEVTTLDASFEIEIEPGATPTCVANIVASPGRWFALQNGNGSDIFIPHADQTRSPNVAPGNSPVGPSPVAAEEFLDWETGEAASAEIYLAPGEDPGTFTCTGETSVDAQSSFDTAAGAYVISVTADVVEPAAICTFTTEQRIFGDVNCDGELSILDAAIIAQRAVGSAPDNTPCPTEPGAGQINLTAADTNDDQVINILDAFRVAQCSVGVPNTLCPS